LNSLLEKLGVVFIKSSNFEFSLTVYPHIAYVTIACLLVVQKKGGSLVAEIAHIKCK
jgi:hypothetical protein